MKTLDEMPKYLRQSFTKEELEALQLLEPYAKDLIAYIQLETGEFDCIGFAGSDGKVTKFANVELYNAICILEEKVRKDLKGQSAIEFFEIPKVNIGWV